MTETKFTPGPWLVVDHLVYALQHDGWRKGQETFCNRFTAHLYKDRQVDKSELEANVALIAAAPDLYAALEIMVKDYIDRTGDIFKAEIHNAIVALAKARGEK